MSYAIIGFGPVGWLNVRRLWCQIERLAQFVNSRFNISRFIHQSGMHLGTRELSFCQPQSSRGRESGASPDSEKVIGLNPKNNVNRPEA
jgi:hypothetical protein